MKRNGMRILALVLLLCAGLLPTDVLAKNAVIVVEDGEVTYVDSEGNPMPG